MMPNVVTVEARSEGRERAGGLGKLYVQHAPAALRLAYFLTGDVDLAEDLVHDAFVKVAGRFRHLRVPDAFEAYLRRTIVNLHNSGLRHRRYERAYLRRERVRGEPATAPAEIHDDLFRALMKLPQRQRAAVVLRYYEDLSEQDAADVIGCSTSALHALVVRAMSALRNEIGSEEP